MTAKSKAFSGTATERSTASSKAKDAFRDCEVGRISWSACKRRVLAILNGCEREADTLSRLLRESKG